MSLSLVAGTDEDVYWEGATSIHTVHPTEPFTFPIFSSGQAPNRGLCYYDRLDLIIAQENMGSDLTMYSYDPILIDNTSAGVSAVDVNGSVERYATVGEWDRISNTQRFYTVLIDTTDRPWVERDPTNFSILDSDAYPNVGSLEHRGALSLGQVGFWRSINTGLPGSPASRTGGGFAFFETQDVAIKACTEVETASGVRRGVVAQIDLTTGVATEVTDIPNVYKNTPDGDWQRPPFGGDEFFLSGLQFIPDLDDTPAAPKGRLMFFSPDVTGIVANERFIYIAFYDWNPTNVVGGAPNRVHKRQRTLTRFACLQLTANTTAGGVGAGVTLGGAGLPIFYHTPTNTIRMQGADRSGLGTDPTAIPDDKTTQLLFSASPAVSQVTKPTELKRVVTNARVDFASDVLGDLGEKIAGVEVQFSIERISTLADNLGTSDGNDGAAKGDFTLTHNPLEVLADAIKITAGTNGDQDLDTEYTIIAPGTAASGNEVEVTVADGDLQFFVGGVATDLANGSIVLATYLHLTVATTPAHGTLLTAVTRSDEIGQVFSQVEYPDNDDLEDLWDKLTVVTT
jgi:hypothetical protein